MTEMRLTPVAPDQRIAGVNDTGAYVTSGLLLFLYGLVPAAWTTYALNVRDIPFEDFLQAALWPTDPRPLMAMTPYEWVFSVALMVVGGLALARRRAARGGALVLSTGLLALSAREAVGLFDAGYRAAYVHSEDGTWLVGTRISGLVVGIVVLILMLRVRDDRSPQVSGSTAYQVAGSAILAAGLLQAAALLSMPGLDDYLANVVDASGHSPASMFGAAPFYDVMIVIALNVIGLLVVLRARVARGAALALVPVAGYISYVTMLPLLSYLGFDFLFSGPHALGSIAHLSTLGAVVLVIALLSRSDTDGAPGQDTLDPAVFAPLPGDLGQQHTRGH